MEWLLKSGNRLFGGAPLLKKAIKKLFGPFIRYYDALQAKKYDRWLSKFELNSLQLQNQKMLAKKLSYRPLMSIIVPTYETPESFFRQMVESVLAQTYENWELILVDDASPNHSIRELIMEYAEKDDRIKYRFLENNLHIAAATNQAIRISSGEFISLFDHDDLLWPDALYEIVKVLNDHPADLIYTDEDKIAWDTNENLQPLFKPDWNPDFLHSVNYITHFTTIRRQTLEDFGYEEGEYNGAQDWELLLRIARNIPAERIYHIPKVLYSWRVHAASTASLIETKPYVAAAQEKAIRADLNAKGHIGFEVTQDALYSAQWSVRFTKIQDAIVIIVLDPGIDSADVRLHIRENTKYGNYEIVSARLYESIISFVKRRDADYVVFIRRITRISNADWLDDLLRDAAREDIGMVAAEGSEDEVMHNLADILSPDKVEFITGVNRRFSAKHLYLTARYNIRTVRNGVVAISADKLLGAVDDEDIVDIPTLSKRITEKGYRNLYNPYVKVLK